MKTSNIERLKERIKENYEEYKKDILQILDGDFIFEVASKIAAVQDVYELSQTSGWIDEAEAAYLLEFAEPLKMLADAWEDFLFDTDSEFRMVVEDVLDNNENGNNYVTAAYADELKRKYGGVYVKDALFSELLETANKFMLLQNMLGDDCEGVGLCLDED